MENKVCKVITNNDVICFIISTKGDAGYWYWEIGRDIWNSFWKEKNTSCLTGDISAEAANVFANSEECSHCGCS